MWKTQGILGFLKAREIGLAKAAANYVIYRGIYVASPFVPWMSRISALSIMPVHKNMVVVGATLVDGVRTYLLCYKRSTQGLVQAEWFPDGMAPVATPELSDIIAFRYNPVTRSVLLFGYVRGDLALARIELQREESERPDFRIVQTFRDSLALIVLFPTLYITDSAIFLNVGKELTVLDCKTYATVFRLRWSTEELARVVAANKLKKREKHPHLSLVITESYLVFFCICECISFEEMDGYPILIYSKHDGTFVRKILVPFCYGNVYAHGRFSARIMKKKKGIPHYWVFKWANDIVAVEEKQDFVRLFDLRNAEARLIKSLDIRNGLLTVDHLERRRLVVCVLREGSVRTYDEQGNRVATLQNYSVATFKAEANSNIPITRVSKKQDVVAIFHYDELSCATMQFLCVVFYTAHSGKALMLRSSTKPLTGQRHWMFEMDPFSCDVFVGLSAAGEPPLLFSNTLPARQCDDGDSESKFSEIQLSIYLSSRP